MANDDRLARTRQAQVEAWERGERLPVEELLERDPLLASDADALLDLIYGEVLLREEAGEQPGPDEYVARFPTHADAIRRQFIVHGAWQDSEGDEQPQPVAVPGYEILQVLGRGGTAVVYQARHVSLNRVVALKMIRDGALAHPEQRTRMRVEAEAIAALRHPDIVQIFDCGEHQGMPFLSLEYVAGGSLESWLRDVTRLDIDVAAELLARIARAIGYAHRQGVVHRDLKPANILLAAPETPDASGTHATDITRLAARTRLTPHPKVTDFGLAKRATNDSSLTASQTLLGTGAYMAPEQARGRSRDVGPAADIHALGVILFEMLTGQTPFPGESFVETLDRVRFESPRPPSLWRADIPPSLDAICLRCLRKEPAERYGSADALADDLDRFRAGQTVEALTDVDKSVAVAVVESTAAVRVAADQVAADQAARDREKAKSNSVVARNSTRLLRMVAIVMLATLCGGSVAWVAWRAVIGPGTGGARIAPTASTRTVGERFAFLVGVRAYRFGDERVELEFTESDVEELSRVLLRHGYPRQNIRLLTQWSEADNPALAPTADNIRRQLRRLLADCIPADTVLVAITGMGGETGGETSDDLGAGRMYCYLPADARLDDRTSLMPLSEFYAMFRESRAATKLLVVDTCQTAPLDHLSWPARDTAAASVAPPGVAAYFACSPGEASFEHGDLRHGVFSYHILRGLEGRADADSDGNVTLDELATFTNREVSEFLRRKMPGAAQAPHLVDAAGGSTVVVGDAIRASPHADAR